MKMQPPATEPTSIKPLPRPAPATPPKPAKPAKPGSPDTQPHADDPALQGEGNYTAARRHRESAEAFVASGQVDQAAHDAAPSTPEEAEQLRAAEEAGRAPAKR